MEIKTEQQRKRHSLESVSRIVGIGTSEHLEVPDLVHPYYTFGKYRMFNKHFIFLDFAQPSDQGHSKSSKEIILDSTRSNTINYPLKMFEQSRIVELASNISKNTAMVAKYLESHGIPSPSFKKDYVEPKDLPTEIMAAKQAIVEATEELNVLALGPTAFLTATHTTILPALHSIYRHDIATKFQIDEATTFADISRKIAMDFSDTERILRRAMTQRIFSEPRPDVVANTAISRAIANTPLLSSYLDLLTEEIWLGSSRVVDVMAKWPGSIEPDETGYNLASGITDAYFEGL
ncbi:6-hydroxytryprostatin B O-methyltransferase protein [Rutstroemia sp. NJR-2017a BVV2]|nr:6-hydroxytryprostatin B O-methyltransferase protein [Rutstroemia sp. NJR-2017a BVV2]PQE18628.1 6-hydroxytryprostatin B O-methyltransferase protein [Rutstroemia sp. NJR-2017a BVV2]